MISYDIEPFDGDKDGQETTKREPSKEFEKDCK